MTEYLVRYIRTLEDLENSPKGSVVATSIGFGIFDETKKRGDKMDFHVIKIDSDETARVYVYHDTKVCHKPRTLVRGHFGYPKAPKTQGLFDFNIEPLGGVLVLSDRPHRHLEADERQQKLAEVLRIW